MTEASDKPARQRKRTALPPPRTGSSTFGAPRVSATAAAAASMRRPPPPPPPAPRAAAAPPPGPAPATVTEQQGPAEQPSQAPAANPNGPAAARTAAATSDEGQELAVEPEQAAPDAVAQVAEPEPEEEQPTATSLATAAAPQSDASTRVNGDGLEELAADARQLGDAISEHGARVGQVGDEVRDLRTDWDNAREGLAGPALGQRQQTAEPDAASGRDTVAVPVPVQAVQPARNAAALLQAAASALIAPATALDFEQRRTTSINLPAHLHEWATDYARATNRNNGDLLWQAIREFGPQVAILYTEMRTREWTERTTAKSTRGRKSRRNLPTKFPLWFTATEVEEFADFTQKVSLALGGSAHTARITRSDVGKVLISALRDKLAQEAARSKPADAAPGAKTGGEASAGEAASSA